MKRHALATLAGALFAVGAIPAFAQDQPPPPPPDPNRTYNLTARYEVGDLLKYKTQMNMTLQMDAPQGKSPFPGGEMSMSMTTRMKTAGIRPSGSAVIAITSEGGEMRMMGNSGPMPQMPPMMMEVDRRGMAKLSGVPQSAGAEIFTQMFNFNQMPTLGAILPDHPVKVGDTWETDVPMAAGMTMKVVSTLLGAEQVGGVDAVKIKQIMTMPMDIKMGPDMKRAEDAAKAMMIMKGSAVVNGILYILESNARLVKMVADVKSEIAMEFKGDAAQQSPFGGTLNMKMAGKMTTNLTSAGKVTAAPKPSNERIGAQKP